jgi:PAS domain S-box-containing protein
MSGHDQPRMNHDLRRRAEELDQRCAPLSTEDIDNLPLAEIRWRFRELRLHQIELEMQNIQLRQTQETLESLQARYFDLYDMAPVGYCSLSEKGLILEANLKASDLLGMARGELVGKRFSRFIHPESNHIYYLLGKQLSAASGPHACELRLLQWDGTDFRAHLSATLAKDDNDQPVTLVTLIAMTRQKQPETVLQRQHALMARSETIARLGSWEWNAATDTVTWSDEMFRLLQLEPTDQPLSFANHSQLYHPADAERMKSAFDKAVINGTPYELEVNVLRKDGETRVCLARGQAETAENGEIRLFGSLQDITEYKQAEARQKQLQPQGIPKQKIESVGTLTGGITYDFNKILGAILDYAHIAIEAIPAECVAYEYIKKIMKAGRRGTDLANQILAFDRQAKNDPIPLLPGHIIKQAVELLHPSLPPTITISQSIAASNRLIFADPVHIHQVLMILCTNALHAMEQTGGILEISHEDHDPSMESLQDQPGVSPGRFVLISVGDTGLGIRPENVEKIFSPYSTTWEIGRRACMGLAIVHGIVSSYGGFIRCESEIGKKTVFRVFFPACEQPVPSGTEPVDPAPPPGNERILLIDDDEILADAGRKMLERLGYEVTVQTSSTTALTLFGNNPERFDAVITDQMMPDLTGMELAGQILRIRPGIPIILCTGFSTQVHEELARSVGIKEFATKPLSIKVIATLLRKVLDGSNGCLN